MPVASAIALQVEPLGVVTTTVEPASAIPVTGDPLVGVLIVGSAGELVSIIIASAGECPDSPAELVSV